MKMVEKMNPSYDAMGGKLDLASQRKQNTITFSPVVSFLCCNGIWGKCREKKCQKVLLKVVI